MGTFEVKIRIAPYSSGNGKVAKKLETMAMVDTGATYSVIPRGLLKQLGVPSVRKVTVQLANGRRARWAEGVVTMKIQKREVDTPVLFGPDDAPALLGAMTLEGAGFGVDPVKKKLIPLEAVALYSIKL